MSDEPLNLWALKPSDLVLLAIAATQEMLKDPLYLPRDDQWHQRLPDAAFDGLRSICMACFAGSVIRKHLGGMAGSNRYLVPASFSSGTRTVLKALDCFRVGKIATGLEWLNEDWRPPNRPMPEFSTATMPQFLAAMRVLAAELREREL